MKSRKYTLLLAAIAAAALIGCSPTSSPSNVETSSTTSTKTTDNPFPGTSDPDMVVLDITSEPLEMNQFRVSDSNTAAILRHCMSGIAKLDEHDNPVPDLAESWEISEDNTVCKIYLRKDALWSNGEPVTANDYYYAWTTQMNPETGTPLAYYLYDKIKNGTEYYKGAVDVSELGIEVIDDYTIQITWERPMLSGLFYLTLPAYFPMNQKSYEQIGDTQYAKDADKMVTNGPYKLTEWVHNDHMMLEKSADYFDADSILIPKVKLVMIGDANARLNAFMAGELDMCGIYSNQMEQIKAMGEGAIQKYIDGGTWYLNFNIQDGYLSNKNLRKALAYSVDVQSLLDNVINDGSVAADGLVPHMIKGAGDIPYADARGSLFAYDPEAAKGYLEEALKELNLSASDLKLTLSVSDTSYNQNQAAYIQNQWKQTLGLDVEIKILAYKALMEAKMAGDYQIVCEAWSADENDAMTFLEIFSSKNSNNYSHYSNPEYDSLISEANVEPDGVKKQDMMIQAEKVLIDDAGIGPLYFTCTSYTISSKLEGMFRTPFQIFNVREGAHIVSTGK